MNIQIKIRVRDLENKTMNRKTLQNTIKLRGTAELGVN